MFTYILNKMTSLHLVRSYIGVHFNSFHSMFIFCIGGEQQVMLEKSEKCESDIHGNSSTFPCPLVIKSYERTSACKRCRTFWWIPTKSSKNHDISHIHKFLGVRKVPDNFVNFSHAVRTKQDTLTLSFQGIMLKKTHPTGRNTFQHNYLLKRELQMTALYSML